MADEPTTYQDALVHSDRQAAIAARAHRIWEESGHVHGQDEQHWRQAEREHDEAESREAASERSNTEPGETSPTKPTKKRVTKAAEPAAEVPAATAQKSRAPRKTSVAALTN